MRLLKLLLLQLWQGVCEELAMTEVEVWLAVCREVAMQMREISGSLQTMRSCCGGWGVWAMCRLRACCSVCAGTSVCCVYLLENDLKLSVGFSHLHKSSPFSLPLTAHNSQLVTSFPHAILPCSACYLGLDCFQPAQLWGLLWGVARLSRACGFIPERRWMSRFLKACSRVIGVSEWVANHFCSSVPMLRLHRARISHTHMRMSTHSCPHTHTCAHLIVAHRISMQKA